LRAEDRKVTGTTPATPGRRDPISAPRSSADATIPAIPDDGRRRAVVESVAPQVDGGQFPIKRVIGDPVTVEADAFADGHDVVSATLRHRRVGGGWSETPMEALGNDRWRASFTVAHLGRYEYAVAARTDAWASWRRDLRTRLEAAQDVSVDLLIGADLVAGAGERARDADAATLAGWAAELRGEGSTEARANLALDDDLDALMGRHADRRHEAVSAAHGVVVEPIRARFSAWYELFPRSTSPTPGRHGTFRDVIGRLDYVAGLGFDVLYLPPIHPIGRAHRKGPNNVTTAGPDDPGVPWAIGAPEGGHTAVHPELGTIDDFRALVRAAAERGIAVGLDLAYQASPDHPWVREHPSWFRQRPDGTVQYAENPPKKYQDIYPFDFESDDWRAMWQHLAEIVRFWIGHGVHIFRVDNPHTKALPFWEWMIDDIKRDHPEVLFLAEAFTRPRVMYRLAKLGFSQSYTYFTWRTTKRDLTSYFEEVSRPPVAEYFRPNVWPNTPDILHETLQHGGRPTFQARVVLAATLAAAYGIYGPAYELLEHTPREAGGEEYLDSEKYQIRHWDLDRPDSIAPLIATLNRVRHEHPALQSNERLDFHPIDDDELIAYTKRSADGGDTILTVVSLDPHRPHSGTLELPLEWLGIAADRPYEVEDLLDGSVRLWHGPRNVVDVDPETCPARLYHVRPQVRTEAQFEYYL
jgi:starch synthase (maltosyl-transferring)